MERRNCVLPARTMAVITSERREFFCAAVSVEAGENHVVVRMQVVHPGY